jgi:hypothetical protein
MGLRWKDASHGWLAVSQTSRSNLRTFERFGSVRASSKRASLLRLTFQAQSRSEGVTASMARQPDGVLILAGAFHSVNGEPRRRLARLEPDGGLRGRLDLEPTAGDPLRLFMPGEVTQILNLRFRRFVTGGVCVEGGVARGLAVGGARRLQIGDTAGCKPALRLWAGEQPVSRLGTVSH